MRGFEYETSVNVKAVRATPPVVSSTCIDPTNAGVPSIARTDDQLRDPPGLCPTSLQDERRSQPKVVPLRGGLTEWMAYAADVASRPLP